MCRPPERDIETEEAGMSEEEAKGHEDVVPLLDFRVDPNVGWGFSRGALRDPWL